MTTTTLPTLPIPAADTDTFDLMRERLRRLHTPKPLDVDEVHRLMAEQILDRDDERYGGWHDPYPDSSPLYSGGGTMFYSLETLASAWSSPASPWHHDPALAERFSLGWACTRRYVYPGCAFPGNWWFWQVGSPDLICRLLLAFPAMFSDDLREHATRTLQYLTDQIPLEHPGCNGMSAAITYFRCGVITNDPAYVELACRYADRASAISPHQGIRPDHSYSFHGCGVNLAYGEHHIVALAELAYGLCEAPWQMAEQTLHNAVNFLLDFVRWTIVGPCIDPFLIDRAVSESEGRQSATGIIEAALLLTEARVPRGLELRRACRWMIDQGNPPKRPLMCELAADLPTQTAPPLVGMRYWPDAEHAVMRHADWSVSIKMATEKNKLYFGINRTNLKGWHISDGHMVIRHRGDEYLNHVVPTMDWERLTGITRADTFKLPAETRGQSWYADGAVSDDGQVGCCGLLFTCIRLDRAALEAFKTWFFLGDAIVALGSSISCDDPQQEVQTIIRHMPLDDAAAPGAGSVQTVTDEILSGPDCSYILPDRPAVEVRIEQRSGCWRDVNATTDDQTTHHRWYWTALLSHGKQPRDQRYAIVYLPGKSEPEARAWWQQKPMEILRQDGDAHQIRDCRRNLTLTVRRWFGASVTPAAAQA